MLTRLTLLHTWKIFFPEIYKRYWLFSTDVQFLNFQSTTGTNYDLAVKDKSFADKTVSQQRRGIQTLPDGENRREIISGIILFCGTKLLELDLHPIFRGIGWLGCTGFRFQQDSGILPDTPNQCTNYPQNQWGQAASIQNFLSGVLGSGGVGLLGNTSNSSTIKIFCLDIWYHLSVLWDGRVNEIAIIKYAGEWIYSKNWAWRKDTMNLTFVLDIYFIYLFIEIIWNGKYFNFMIWKLKCLFRMCASSQCVPKI